LHLRLSPLTVECREHKTPYNVCTLFCESVLSGTSGTVQHNKNVC